MITDLVWGVQRSNQIPGHEQNYFHMRS